MKRFKKANVGDTAKVSEKENRDALEVVGASPSVAQKKRMNPRECPSRCEISIVIA